MNICTYVSVVNMNPKIYMIAIDYSTLTYQNLITNKSSIILQGLSKKNIKLVRSLGKKSGKKFNKNRYLEKNKLTQKWKNYTILNNVSFAIELTEQEEIHQMRDHAIFVFKMKSFKNFNQDILSFNELIENKIIL